ncbi:MAG: TIGR01777 family protein [Synechococcales cyanobacterium RU_4_20]|nr:TIGR01777 family protein [Synechococcales cyanobacterium RU_4_20]NJR71556.1 TIGR01777 family protein [Synechococcales cyanobacterium CRU_2_2]
MKIAVTGATGFVGQRLVEKLTLAGHEVRVLTRNPALAQRRFPAARFPQVVAIAIHPDRPEGWQQAILGCDGVVNLAGEPIAEKRWNETQKQEILQSRIKTTEQVVKAILQGGTEPAAQADSKPAVLVSASAIGFYGTSETASFDEDSPSGDDFLAEVCRQWEAAAQPVTASGTRLVILRIGIVVGNGGAIAKMLPAFWAFAGGPIGTGQQWFSWIYREDLVDLIIQALTDGQMSGTYNATSPNPVRMKTVAEVMGNVLGRPSWLPVPGFALDLLLGEGAKVVLEGQQVLPKRTQVSGFQFQFPDLAAALKDFL